ncbi:MAG: hypothetical protein ABJG68_03315 [Crocinitomicaceae bacterium]
MKTTVLIICLIVLGVFSQNNQAFAHSPDSYTSTIYKDADGWNLQITFGSYGILESLKKYSKDFELQLSNSSKFKTLLDKYLQEHVQITANKEIKAVLGDYRASVNHHAVDVFYTLDSLPMLPLYWDIMINAQKENLVPPTNLTIIRIGDHMNSFKLTEQNSYTVQAMKNTKGGFKSLN